MGLSHAIGVGVLASVLAACATEEPVVDTTSQEVWVNGDFEEDAGLTGWNVTTNLNPAITDLRPGVQTLASLNLAPGGVAITSNVSGATETMTDPDVGAAGTLRYPKYGQHAARVNYGGAGALGNGGNSNTLQQQMTVGLGDVDPTDDKVHVRFAVAPVLQNPGHSFTEQPYYFVRLRNVTTGAMLYQDFNASGQPGVPWKNFTDTSAQAAQYTDWQLVDIAPGNALLAVGDQVELTIVASGCSPTGHWGRVYVDAVGSGIPGLYAWATGAQQANSGSDLTYTIFYKNGGTTMTNGTKLDFVTPPSTTFQSASLGAACTAPAVGGTGTVSCPLGSLANGSVGSFTVTVRIPSGTVNGTVITNGNYAIYATGVSSLVGPKVFTTVTSSVQYADLRVSLTDDVAALGWGQATTYALRVTNAGPVAATAARVRDTMPARLTGVTWTCTATLGGACAASGSGSIDDSTVSLPVGATATYTINASIIAGTGSASVVQTATASLIGAVVDPDTTNDTAVDTNAIGTLRTLTVTKLGTAAAGGLSSTPASIACAAGCTGDAAEFLDGSQIVLTAAPIAGATFVGWGGACAGTASSCTLTLAGDQGVTASFVGAASSATAQGGGGQIAATGAAFATPLTVLVTDAAGTPVPDLTVTFTAPSTGASASLSSSTAMTDAAGVATITATATATAGAYQVTAIVPGVGPNPTFTLQNLGAPAAIAITGGATQSAVVGAAFTAPLTVRVTDSAGAPRAGITVTFAAPSTGATASLGDDAAITDEEGVASVPATAGTTGGAYAVTATVPGVEAASFALTNLVGPATTLAITGGQDQHATAGGAFAAPFAVSVVDAHGNAVTGAVVTFTAPETGATAIVSSSTATTGAAGAASIGADAGTIAGALELIASTPSLAPVAFTATIHAAAPATLTVTGGSPQGAVVATAFAEALTVRVADVYDNPVPAAVIAFTAPSATVTATLSAPSAITDEDGVAGVAATAGTRAGALEVVAAIGELSGAFALTNRPGAAATIVAEGGGGQAARVGEPFAVSLGAVVQDAYGNAVPDVTVAFAAPPDGATATLSSTGVDTDADGGVSIQATADRIAGGYDVTATIAGLTPARFALVNLPGDPASLEIIGGEGQEAVVTTAFAAPLVFGLRDGNGNAVPGTTVTFEVPAAPAGAALSAPAAITDEAGAVSITATANTRAGEHAVVARAGDLRAKLALTSLPGAPAAITLAEVSSPQTATVLEPFAAPLRVTITDAHANTVPGAVVTFAAPVIGPTASLGAAAVTTAGGGTASVPATAGPTAGAYVVTAAVDGVATPATFSLTNVPGVPARVIALGEGAQATVVDTDFDLALAVAVVDAEDNPVPGAVVVFGVPADGASADLASPSVATGEDGVAETRVHAGTVAGDYLATAMVLGAASPATFALTNLADVPASITADLLASPQRAQVTTAYPRALGVTVRDAHGNPAPEATVVYAAPGAGASVIDATSASTDADGHAAIDVTANTIAGTFEVTATVDGAESPARFDLGNLAGAAYLLALVSGSSQDAVVDTAFGEPVVLYLEDVHGNPVPDAEITIAAPASGATADVASPSPRTDAAGRAETAVTAGTVAGAYALVAATPEGAAPVEIALRNRHDVAATARGAAASSPQTAEVQHAFGYPLVVVVEDQFGNPVHGAPVAFAAPAAGPSASFGAADVVTDLDGVALALAIAGERRGSYAATATVDGVLEPVVFALTNTASAPAAVMVRDGGGQRTLATTAFAAPLAVRVVDGFGNPVAGAQVVVSVPFDGPTATMGQMPLTDEDGDAFAPLTAGDKVGRFDAVITVEGAAMPVLASFTVDAVPTTLTASAADASIDAGLDFVIAVSSAHGTPTGDVTIVDDRGAVLGTATLDDGRATVHLDAVALGAVSLAAVYDAQGSFGASRSADVTAEILADEGTLSGGGCSTGGGGSSGLVLVLLAAFAVTRRGARRFAALGVVALGVAHAGQAAAQPAGARAIGRYHQASADSAWFTTDSVSFEGHNEVALSIVADAAHRPLVIYDADGMEREVVVRDAQVVQLGVSVTAQDRLRLSANVAMATYQSGNGGTYNGMAMPEPELAFGDVEVSAALRVVGQPGAALRAAIELRAGTPTGSRTHYMSDGVFSLEPRALVAGSAGAFEYAASAGAQLRPRSEMAGLEFGSELRYAVGAGFRVLGDRVLVGPELVGATPLVGGTASGHPVELDLGAHVTLRDDLTLGLGAGAGLVNAVGAPERRAFLSLAWTN